MQLISRCLFCAASLALLLIIPAREIKAAVINVPTSFRTIQSAIDSARAGDIVRVSAGRYSENVRLKEGVILRGASAETTIIDGGGKGNVVEGAREAVIEGFTITGSGNQGITGTKMDVGISADHTPMTIANCKITGNNTGVRSYFAPLNIVNNVISNNKVFGLYVLYSDSTISNNIISDNGSYGIYNSYSNPTITNNTILKNFDGIYSEVSRVVVENNIVVDNTAAGIHWVEFPDAQNDRVAPVLSYNLVWGNKNNYVNVSPATGDMSRDPMFTNTAKGDLHLRKGSPAIDSGSPESGDKDVNGSRNDIGAYGGPLSIRSIPSPTDRLTFASLKINTATLPEPDYSNQAAWTEGSSSGKGNFQSYCVTCHGAEGKGDGLVGATLDIKPRDLSYAEYMQNLSDDHIFNVIKNGGASIGLSENMIPLGNDLSDEAIRNIIAYIRKDICKCSFAGGTLSAEKK